ncbi:hypothetical protein PHET_08910 [Paragonimus heterotremus]|uniref:Prolyl-tRNA synthetase n=1 Tax=Paragonimus heterotremus TaxID=100268 RepID=A0A8J4WF50_9TREM|nr:hypothetical protein PHET_08910 [Paragonimus heterotremus]
MGCFGLGLTRLLAASIEYFSVASFPELLANEITELRWPPGISPFTGAVALQKESAKDALSPNDLKLIMDTFSGPDHDASRCRLVPGDILIDDRKGLSLGRKLIDLKRLGIPWIVIAKANTNRPQRYELVDVHRKRSAEASPEQIQSAFENPITFDSSTLPEWKYER